MADIGNVLHGAPKPNDYFKQIDDRKQIKSQAVNTDFQKIVKSDQVKAQTKIDNNKAAKASPSGVAADGTDFALRKLSEDFEKQILGIMWNMVFAASEKEFEGGLGEELFHKELVNEMVKLSNTGEMGEIAKSIYNDLKKKDVQEKASFAPFQSELNKTNK